MEEPERKAVANYIRLSLIMLIFLILCLGLVPQQSRQNEDKAGINNSGSSWFVSVGIQVS